MIPQISLYVEIAPPQRGKESFRSEEKPSYCTVSVTCYRLANIIGLQVGGLLRNGGENESNDRWVHLPQEIYCHGEKYFHCNKFPLPVEKINFTDCPVASNIQLHCTVRMKCRDCYALHIMKKNFLIRDG